MGELIIYWVVKFFGAFLRILPINMALGCGKFLGVVGYHLSAKHRKIVIANLKTAFSAEKTPEEIIKIAKATFINYGQNLVEIFRFPVMSSDKFNQYVQLEGREHIDQALGQGRGVILLATHFGSWELASRVGAILGHPYKVLVKPQTKYSRLATLLNSHRTSANANVVERGMGTREILRSLQNNEVVAMVADQGGRDGVAVPFFGKEANMSVGALRLGMKYGIPVCFVNISRVKGPYHKLVVHKPLDLINTGDLEKDLTANLKNVVSTMEQYIRQTPAEYMWFYKIWKYSKETIIKILTDGKAGHLRQSEALASALREALGERGKTSEIPISNLSFKSKMRSRFCSVFCVLINVFFAHRGRNWLLRFSLTNDSYAQLMSLRPDFIISCGSSIAPINYLLSKEQESKSIVILKPGMIGFKNFDLVVLPRHDIYRRNSYPSNVVVTQGAPNLVTELYLEEQTKALLRKYSHLKLGDNFKIGVLLGGDTPEFILSEQRIRILIHQLIETADEVPADLLLTTSRRTSAKVENLIARELKRYPRCKFLVLANRENVPEAVGGILGLSDVVVVSGDSISMVSEAASSGKKVATFFVERRDAAAFEKTKHGRFLEQLNSDGFILTSEVKHMKDSIYKLVKNKVQTKKLNDHAAVLAALQRII